MENRRVLVDTGIVIDYLRKKHFCNKNIKILHKFKKHYWIFDRNISKHYWIF